jgi:signal transduction histidine kinase
MVGFQVVGGSRGSDCRFLPSFFVSFFLFFFFLFFASFSNNPLSFVYFHVSSGFPLFSFTSFRICFFSAQIKQRRSISSRSCPPNGWRTATSIRQPRYIQLSNICTNELRTTHCVLKIESLRPLWHLVHHRRHDLGSTPYGISNR